MKLQKAKGFEEWVQDLGNTRGRLSLFNRTFDLYSSMKFILSKVLSEMVEKNKEALHHITKNKVDLVPLKRIGVQL